MIIRALFGFLKIILYRWIGALIHIVRLIIRRLFGREHSKQKTRHERGTRTNCVPIDRPEFVRPDPLIYSQRQLVDLGLAVTWDNPDIVLFHNGVPVPSHQLLPATTYSVQARIWNNSFKAPIIQMPLHLSFLDFGIGTEPIPIGTTTADVGVKGGPGHPGFATVLWTTPPTPGHYCLQVRLDPVDDLDRSNNLGQENTDVVAAQSPAHFEFALRNDQLRAQEYRFEVDSYTIPARPRCDDGPIERKPQIEAHRRVHYPIPAGFTVTIDPATPTLAPNERVTIGVDIEPPDDFVGSRPFNVNAFVGQRLVGGVTLTMTKA